KLDSLERKPQKKPQPLTFEEVKERVTKGDDPRTFDGIPVLFGKAKENMAKADEVKGWAEALLKSAADYGPRWQREVTFNVAERLARAEGYGAVAEGVARSAIKMLGEKASADVQLRGLEILAAALKRAGKADELKTVTARVDRLEGEAYKAHEKTALPFE